MIKLAFDSDLHQLENVPLQEMMDNIIHFHYPLLTLQLTRIEENVSLLHSANKMAGKAILVKIRQELNGIIAKEQLLIFPLVTILHQKNNRTECSPFKLVKKHYRALLSAVTNLRFVLRSETIGYTAAQPVLDQVAEFENNVVQLQQVKEKRLFTPFKSCQHDCKAKYEASSH